MKLSKSIKPTSHSGTAKAVPQDILSCEQTQDGIALLEILSYSTKNMNSGNYKPAKTAFSDISAHTKEM